MNQDIFPGRLGLQQRVLPEYRVQFMDALAESCQAGLGVFAGLPQIDENIATSQQFKQAAYFPARNRHISSPASPFYFCWQSGILDWLESWQPDALIVEANSRYLATPRAIIWMRSRNRPVLGWGLGAPSIAGLLAGWRQRSRLNFLLSLDGVIAYSEQGATEYATLGISPQRIFVAPNAVTPPPSWPMPVRQPVFVGKPMVLFVGRLQNRKRVDNLLRACAALPESLQPELNVVGDGPARQALEELAQRIYPGTVFPGARHGAELQAYFESADLFVLPGTGGLAVQQAMSYGLPVIVAQGDGTQNDLVRPSNGWAIPPNDLRALRQAIESALSDPAKLRRMGAESYRIVAEEINIDKMVSIFVHALQTVTK